MQDLLDYFSEEKRNILLQYPFITAFINGKLKRKIFLSDLRNFQKQIISASNGIIIESDIEYLIRGSVISQRYILKFLMSLLSFSHHWAYKIVGRIPTDLSVG